jgi:hypothetical protein
LNAAKSLMERRNTVVLTSDPGVSPAAASTAFRFMSARVACSSIESPVTVPETGSSGICPDTKTSAPVSIAWE